MLFRRQMDIFAPPAPRPDAPVEPGQRRVFGGTPLHEAAEGVHGGEVVEARPGADGCPADGLNEVDLPGIAVVLEVQEARGMAPARPVGCR
jgi:hypothetical protein